MVLFYTIYCGFYELKRKAYPRGSRLQKVSNPAKNGGCNSKKSHFYR